MKNFACTLDIETTNLAPDFGIVLCAVIKPFGGEAKVYRIDSKKRWTRDDTKLVGDIITELNKYVIIVAHNGTRFDRRFLNGRALRHGLPLLNPKGKIIDPLSLAWKHLNLKMNSLEKLSWFLGCEHEKTPTLPDTWLAAAIDHDPEALQLIVDHCIADVLLLEEVLEKMQALVGNINEWGSA